MFTRNDVIAVDGGFGVFSAVNLAGKRVSFRSAVVKLNDSDREHANWVDKTGAWLVGDQAVLQGSAGRQSTDTRYYSSDEFRVMTLYALSQLGAKNASVITGLPQESYRALREEHSKNVKEFTKTLRKGDEFSISSVVTIPQVMGTLTSPKLKDWEGNPVDLSSGKIGLIDIGDGTIDGAEAYDGKPNPKVSYGRNKGCSDIHREILQGFMQSKKYDIGSDVSVHMIDRYLREGVFFYRGDKIDVNKVDFIRKAKENYLPEITQAIKEMWGSGNTLRYIVVTGGGPALLGRDLIERVIPKKQLVIPENSGEANVDGFLEMLRMSLEQRKMVSR